MRLTTKYLVIALPLFTLGLFACKKWDDHTAVMNPNLNENLLQEINKHSNLSKFAEYLVKTGLDKEISSSKTYTVWAPTNDALQSIDPAVVADTAKLKQFLSNHIANQQYYTSTSTSDLRVPLLNGKRVSFNNKKFDDANLTEADVSVGNGVLHVLDKAVAPLPNAWEFVNTTTAQYKQSAFIVSQNFNGFDPNTAVVDSISSTTGLPIYKPGTGIVPRNRYNDQVLDLKSEDKLYTFFVLNDTALKREVDSLTTYFKTSTADSTSNLATWAVAKDAVVEGLYTLNQLPATLTSKFGVTFPIDKNDIVETRRVSNGIVYVMKKLDYRTTDKIPSFIIQGETPSGFMPGFDKRSVTFYRVRQNPVTKEVYNDIAMTGIGVANYYIRYRLNGVPSTKYKVYWVAVNDLGTVFSQRLAMGDPASATFALRTVNLNDYSEVLLGEYTMNSYGSLDMYLTSANNTATNVTNSLVLDYIKLVPSN